jgi:parallel beta-helix repeat protein
MKAVHKLAKSIIGRTRTGSLLLLLCHFSFSSAATEHVVDDGELIQAAINKASNGDVIKVMPGTYKETIYIDKENITLSGVIVKGQRPLLDGENTLNDAILAAGHGVIIENFLIKHYKANGIMTQGANNFIIRNNIIVGTSVYGIFPQFGKNGLVSHNILSKVEDAAIYVGMCDNVDVVYNETFDSVMGIETENSQNILIEGNYIHDNAVGFVASLVPGLPIKTATNTLVRNNFIINNNIDNFAPPGAIAAGLPSGVGAFIFAADEVRFEGNIIKNNVSAGIVFADHASFSASAPPDPAMDPRPDKGQVLMNVFVGNGTAPKDDIAAMLVAAGIERGPDLLATGKGRKNCVQNRSSIIEAGTERWTECDAALTTADIKTFQLDKPVESAPLTLEQKGRITYLSVCTGCHTYATTIIGPPMVALQATYAGKPEELVRYLKNPIKKWPGYPEMPPQNYLPDDVLLETAKYVLQLKP